METRLFAVLDDAVQNRLRLKIVHLEEQFVNGRFHHTLSGHNTPASEVTLCRTKGDDLDITEFNLPTKTIHIWRTGWAVYYRNNWLHILDSDSRESLPGDFTLTGRDVNALRDQVSRRLSMLETDIQDLMPPTPSPVQTQIPRFVAEIMRRDAVAAKAVCAISLDPLADISVSITSCFHMFHTESINTWLEKDSSCPVCKVHVNFVQPI